MRLAVSTASHVGRAGDLIGSLGGTATPEIKAQTQGIFQNVTDPSELSDQRVNLVALAAVTAGVWCGVGCLIAFVSAHRHKSGRRDLAAAGRHVAPCTAQRKLAEARTCTSPPGRSMDALRAIRSALVGLIADMRNVVAEGLTASEADTVLAETAVPAGERTAVLRLLQAIESAEYGAGVASEIPAMIETAEGLIPALARHLERGS